MRPLSALTLVLLTTVILSGCMHAGIFVVPTAPTSLETSETVEPTVETTAANVTAPPETVAPTQPETSPPPQPTTKPEPTVPVKPEPTVPTQPTFPSFPDSDTLRPDPYGVDSFVLSDMEQSFLAQIHAMRAEKELPTLETENMLCALAYIRARETFMTFRHQRPDGSDYSTVFSDFGYSCTASKELIMRADLSVTVESMLETWLTEELTKNVLIDPDFTHVGVGVYMKNGFYFVTCLLTK